MNSWRISGTMGVEVVHTRDHLSQPTIASITIEFHKNTDRFNYHFLMMTSAIP